MKCENCCREHDGSYGSGRFCSTKCSRGFSTKAKRKEINEKVSKTLSYGNVILKCKYCKEKFEISYTLRHRPFCSQSCSTKFTHTGTKRSKETKKKISESVLQNYKDGKQVYGGTTKWYDYKDIRVQGTYELRTCKILDIWKEYNVIKDWEYTKDRVKYIGEDGKEHTYLLDFKIIANEGFYYYIETKGYKTDKDILKWKAVREKGYKLEVWFEEDIALMELDLYRKK